MYTIAKLLGSKPKPYQNPLKVKVCGIGTPESYTIASGQKKTSIVLGLADSESVIKAMLYDQEKLTNLKVLDTLMLMNYVLKKDPDPVVVITKVTKIMKTSNLEVPNDIVERATQISNPPPAGIMKLKAAKTSPAKALISVRGRVTSEEIVRTVQVKGQDVAVQTIKIQDETAEVKVSLWREKTETCTVGSFLEFSNVVVNHYQEEVSLSTTCKTKIQQCEAPPSVINGTILAFEKSELGFSLMVEEDDNFHHVDMPLHLLTSTLNCEEGNIEKQISDEIPFACRITLANGNVVSFTK